MIRKYGYKYIKTIMDKQNKKKVDIVPFDVLEKVFNYTDRYCDKYIENNLCLYRSLIAKYLLKCKGYNVSLCNGYDKKNKLFHTWLEDGNCNTLFENKRKYERIS